jgi:hypothetical protein
MNRRALLASSVAVLGLAGCATTTTSTVAATVVSDAGLIADGLLSLLTSVGSIVGITPATVAAIGNYVAQAKAAAATIVPTITAALAAPSVQTIGSAVSSIMSALGSFSLPASIQTLLTAAQTLLPVLETAVGIAVAVAATPGGMTADQARAILAAAR